MVQAGQEQRNELDRGQGKRGRATQAYRCGARAEITWKTKKNIHSRLFDPEKHVMSPSESQSNTSKSRRRASKTDMETVRNSNLAKAKEAKVTKHV